MIFLFADEHVYPFYHPFVELFEWHCFARCSDSTTFFLRLYYCLKEVSLLLFSLKNGVVFVSFFIAGQRHP